MKYDGTGWCKQTAAIEEGRRCSCSFTHWCACRPGTKGPLMKVLTEAQGARGEGMVSDGRANQTTPHHTVPYHARAILPSLTPRRCSLPSLHCLSLDSRHRVFTVPCPQICSSSGLTVKSGWTLKQSTLFLTPSSPPQLPFCPSRLGPQLGLDLNRAIV